MSKPTPLSGFPEWLPDGRIVEQYVLDQLRSAFELHGFASIETRSVEPLDQLLQKGETDKEIYLLRRLQADSEAEGEVDSSGLGLHFDLTVPFARYVLENAGRLQFPFRRYQIQRVWRGERPQEGRYREFTQADIDVVARDELPFHYEVELPLVIGEALGQLPIPPVRIHTNSRKISEGFYRGLGIDDVTGTLRAVDKLDKIGPERVAALLTETVGCSEAVARACVALAGISSTDGSFADQVQALGVRDPGLDEGLEQLTRVVETAREYVPGLVVADLRIARGLDYYTGTVYETVLEGYEQLGSICSGGRYDSLVSTAGASGTGQRFPGVGLSIGVTRLLGPLLARNLLTADRTVPTCVLVALPDEESRSRCLRIATSLRSRGIPTEVAPDPAKYGKQIRFADRRGIPYVWFPGADGSEVRNIRSGEQIGADPDSWRPPEADLRPRIVGDLRQTGGDTGHAENVERT